ncbi:MAG: trimeric autotransporter adhesin, partial [Thermoanaerobaculia bacterium]|nr:trimeric autotransporter adhesin [Thermoanaerobaculia bacterium]
IPISNGGTFNGTVSGVVDIQGSMPGATVTTTHLSGNASVGTVSGGWLTPGTWNPSYSADPHSTGVLHTKTLTASRLSVDLNPSGVSDQVQVTGTVNISGVLGVTIASGSPAVGQTFTIIDNDGVDPINGTFASKPEGSMFSLGGQTLRISYQGGDGNDVVLAVLAETSTALSQSVSTTRAGETWTLTATVSSPFGVPTGSVAFSADGTVLGSAPVVSGVASLTTSIPNSGSHHVLATFLGSEIFANSVSVSLVHDVSHGQTKTMTASSVSNTVYGQPAHFTVTVTVLAPAAGAPGGNITLVADGLTLGSAPIVSESATFESAVLHAGIHAITATYNGDSNFDGSTSTPMQQNVAKARTEVDARLRSPIFVGQSPIVTAAVNASPNFSVVPAGAVTLSERDANLASQALVDGRVAFSLSPLSWGDHILTARYDGNDDFEASSETVVQSVVAPAISIADTRVAEGNQGVTTVTLVVTLSVPVPAPVRVSFSTLPGTAKEGEDYEKASGVIEFAPGELVHSIELHIAGDALPEADETYSVQLSDPVNATLAKPSAVIVIANDDQVPPRHRPSRP